MEKSHRNCLYINMHRCPGMMANNGNIPHPDNCQFYHNNKPSCLTCYFNDQQKCRFDSPKMNEAGFACWPYIMDEKKEWCGRYKNGRT